ncbi:DUF4276 family protein [Halosquirtibacter xylanolyticus]|uniref:DUF4276 family protein n=1 Tax=Halosquirtibacter xylanolyticus TaxID=3374599 RepID=UPI00374A4CB8|nr:DUF4276 family protein [Prolixibacteraceae bacterium]
MKRVVIIGEGPTEQEFCKDLLQPLFNEYQCYIQVPKIKKSQGGIVHWNSLKKEIALYLEDRSVYVTTLLDYYGIESKHEFPKWDEAQNIVDKTKRMDFLEQAMADDLDSSVRYRFIPYLQLHEFEGLLFSDVQVIEDNFELNEFNDLPYLKDTELHYLNPEDINSGKGTAPSKRLERIFKNYNKVVYGSLLASAIGLGKIRSKCPRFNQWIDKLLSLK